MEINDITPETDWKEYTIQDEPVPSTPKNIVSAAFLNGMANAIKGLLTQVQSLMQQLGLIDDFVVEKGSNANGRWEKWDSGKLVQWGEGPSLDLSFVVWNGGSSVYSSGGNSVPSMTFPIPFIEPPLVLVEFHRDGSGNYWITESSQVPTTTSTGSYELTRGSSRPEGIKGRMKYKAEGLWK